MFFCHPCQIFALGLWCVISGGKAMARKKPRGPGRPPRREGERLSKNRTFRVRGALDALLQAAANEAGHSISEEIEHRLEASFHGEHIVNMLTGGGNNALGAISRVMQLESDW